MPSRRRFLAGSGVAFALHLCGCQGESGTGTPEDVEWDKRFGRMPPVSLEREPVRGYEYLDGEDRVRYESDSGERRRMPFEEWGTRRATAHARDHLRARLRRESMLVDGVSVAVGTVETSEFETVNPPPELAKSELDRAVDIGPVVFYLRHYSGVGTPSALFYSVVNVTPVAYRVTMLFPEREYTATVPALCKRYRTGRQ